MKNLSIERNVFILHLSGRNILEFWLIEKINKINWQRKWVNHIFGMDSDSGPGSWIYSQCAFSILNLTCICLMFVKSKENSEVGNNHNSLLYFAFYEFYNIQMASNWILISFINSLFPNSFHETWFLGIYWPECLISLILFNPNN